MKANSIQGHKASRQGAARRAARTHAIDSFAFGVSLTRAPPPPCSAEIVYTPWANLRKSSECVRGSTLIYVTPFFCVLLPALTSATPVAPNSMEVGQVGFRDEKAVLRAHVAARNNEILNRLQKSRQERFPNLAAEREAYDAEVRAERKAAERQRRKEEEEAARERRRAEQERSYDRIMDSQKMMTNKETAEKYASVEEAEEDFM